MAELDLKEAIKTIKHKLSFSSDKITQEEADKLLAIEVHVENAKKNLIKDPEIRTWLGRVQDQVNDLNELVEQLSSGESSQSPMKNKVFNQLAALLRADSSKLKDITGELSTALPERSPARRRRHGSLVCSLKAMSAARDHGSQIKAAIEALETVVAGKPDKVDVALRKSELKKLDGIIKEVELISRKTDVEEITEKLLLDTNQIVPIVGIEGSGKTKLAEEVSAKFESKVWVQIGESFDWESIESKISGEINFSKADPRSCLVVLDDLKNVDSESWLKFKEMLRKSTGGLGCRVLITTPSVLVARTTGTVSPHTLRGLDEDQSSSLFEKVVFSGDEFDSKYVEAGKMILDKCRGVPLAIKCLGKLCWPRKSEEITKPEESILKSIEEEFLQEVALEYYGQLSFPLKRCFAFCSLFPEDYIIDVQWLIKLWVGEAFILSRISSSKQSEDVGHSSSSKEINDSSSSQSLEDIGYECLNEFLRRSIFEDPEDDDLGQVRSCKIHPLMHELAKYVAGNESIAMDPDGKKVKKTVYHVSFDFNLDVSTEIPEALFNEATELQTILLPAPTQSGLSRDMMTGTTWDSITASFKRLRVLDLHNLGVKTVPSSLSNLSNLTYLDLSRNKIEKLPSIVELVHLQILRLSQCHLLKELPKGLEQLIKLRHLEIDGCLAVTHMPQGIRNLTSLRTLSVFVGSDNNIHTLNLSRVGGLGELANLNNLSGKFEISHLERCYELEAKKANLRKKQNVQHLVLRWDRDYNLNSDDPEESNLENSDQELIENLKPQSKLKVLFVMGYGGKGFSSWLSSLKDLVKLSLYNCPKCISLPRLDQLFSLEILQLQKLDSLEYIGEDSGGDASSSPSAGDSFHSLKKLTISDCPKLTNWETYRVQESFPHISKLEIQYCPKLASMPLYPSLRDKLVIVGSCIETLVNTIKFESSDDSVPPLSKLKSMLIAGVDGPRPAEDWLKNFTSLQELHIRECHCLRELPNGFNHLCSLERLTIEDCNQLDPHKSSHQWESLKKLHYFTIREIPKLDSLPEGLGRVSSLQYLEIHGCHDLASLSKIGELTSLGELVITECYKLASLPEEIKTVESLKRLTIKDCPELWPRVQEDSGDDWPKIKHIEVKNISLT